MDQRDDSPGAASAPEGTGAKSVTVRLVIAFLVAPLVPSLILLLLPPMAMSGVSWWAASFALRFTVISEVIIGIPLHLLFLRMRWTSPFAYAGIGGGCGLGAAIGLFFDTVLRILTTHDADPLRSIALVTLIFCGLGAFSGLVFWGIGRPDRARRLENA